MYIPKMLRQQSKDSTIQSSAPIEPIRNNFINYYDNYTSGFPLVHWQVVRRLLLWILVFCWNVASPFKCWFLGRYEISSIEVSFNVPLDWSDQLEYRFVKYLYDQAQVHCDIPPGQPTRLINLYIDMMVLPKAANWAQGLNKWHQDPAIGRYCQSGLVARQSQQMYQILALNDTPVFMWGDRVDHFIPDQPNCSVNEVPEAIMCLKGFNASMILNLDWSTGLNESDPTVHDALAAWQEIMLPDLPMCLQRRQHLLNLHGSKQRGFVLNVLARELAHNYSLQLNGWAGKSNMMNVFWERVGFIDLPGKPAGTRKLALSGQITERNRNNFDGDAHAVTVLRERLWVCADLVTSTNTKDLRQFHDCLVEHPLAQPSFFLGSLLMKTDSELGDRYLDDNYLVNRNTTIGNRIRWDYQTSRHYLNVTYLTSNLNDSVETAYRDKVDQQLLNELLDENHPPLLYKCFYVPGCAETCRNVTGKTAEFYFLYAIKRSGFCYLERMEPDLIIHNSFVTRDCYGIGKGDTTLLYMLEDSTNCASRLPTSNYLEIPGLLDPMAILACIIGGRVPSAKDTAFPTSFENMIRMGSGMVLTAVYSFGSERVLLNMCVLVALLGCSYYSMLVVHEGAGVLHVLQKAQKYRQATCGDVDRSLDELVAQSVAKMSISSRVWRLHYLIMAPFGFLTILQWHLGASRTMCTWYVNGTNMLQVEENAIDPSCTPEYKCDGGDPLGHLSSFGEAFRLLTYSFFVSFIFIGRNHVAGFNRFVATRWLSITWFVFVPGMVTPILVTALNQLRLYVNHPTLTLLHNQCFVALAWMLLLWLWNRCLNLYRDALFWILQWFGFTRRELQPKCLGYKHLQHFVVHESELLASSSSKSTDAMGVQPQPSSGMHLRGRLPSIAASTAVAAAATTTTTSVAATTSNTGKHDLWVPLSVVLETFPLSKLKRLNFEYKAFDPKPEPSKWQSAGIHFLQEHFRRVTKATIKTAPHNNNNNSHKTSKSHLPSADPRTLRSHHSLVNQEFHQIAITGIECYIRLTQTENPS